MAKFIILICMFIFSINSSADDLDDLIKTQKMLLDPEQRKEMIQTEEAAKADETANIVALGRSENKQTMYEIAAHIMPWLLETTQGDTTKMQQLLELAKKNPQQFYMGLPESEKAKIKSLASTIESQRKPNSKSYSDTMSSKP